MAVEETVTCVCSYKHVSWSGHVLKTMTVEMYKHFSIVAQIIGKIFMCPTSWPHDNTKVP